MLKRRPQIVGDASEMFQCMVSLFERRLSLDDAGVALGGHSRYDRENLRCLIQV